MLPLTLTKFSNHVSCIVGDVVVDVDVDGDDEEADGGGDLALVIAPSHHCCCCGRSLMTRLVILHHKLQVKRT